MSSMRDRMPQTAAFVDALREAFGREAIDDAIRAGLAGEPRFHATEGGHQIGTPVLGDDAAWVEVWPLNPVRAAR